MVRPRTQQALEVLHFCPPFLADNLVSGRLSSRVGTMMVATSAWGCVFVNVQQEKERGRLSSFG